MLKKLSYFLALAFLVSFMACKGDQGDVGPQGDKGDTGAQGVAGPAGADGEDGAGSLPLLLSTGVDSTFDDGNYYLELQDLTADAISVLDKSAILVYIKSGGAYWPLPGIVGFGQAISDFKFVYGIQETTFFVDLYQYNWSEDQETPPFRKFQDVRVIIMPTQDLARQNQDIDFTNYEEVVEKLGLDTENIGRLTRKVK